MSNTDRSVERRASAEKIEVERSPSHEKTAGTENSIEKEPAQQLEEGENSEEELDEFGRVMRRREKFKNERSEEADSDNDTYNSNKREDRYHSSKRHRRRSSVSSSSRSPPRKRGRSYRRHSDSDDSEYDHRNNRHRSSSRHGRYSYSSRSHRSHHHHISRGGDVYAEASQYIDTEFYPTKVYIGDLEGVTEAQIETVFSRFGDLEDVKLVEGKDYGFITFERKEAALAAIQSMHGALFGSKHIKVNRAKIPERNKVGFGNVPWQDEDGIMAKEAGYNSSKRRRSSMLMKFENTTGIASIQAVIPPGRTLTTYDDL